MPPTPSEEIEPVKSKPRAIPLQNYLTDGVYYDTLYTEADRVNEIWWIILSYEEYTNSSKQIFWKCSN